MPQGGSKKNKKGRAPAHQNAFAFQHNAKSKKTEKILNSPNIHVCRRCHDKIEWRKKYRKYKPLTQPTKCNLCGERKIKAAYHTICTNCTISDKARNAQRAKRNDDVEISTVEEMEIYRVCAVCVKEPALPGDDDDGAESNVESDLSKEMGRMKLREKRAMERKMARQLKEAQQGEGDSQRLDGEDNGIQDVAEAGDDVNEGGSGSDEKVSGVDDVRVEEDPFLKAVGGSDKLLTGEAYQEMLLEREGQKS